MKKLYFSIWGLCTILLSISHPLFSQENYDIPGKNPESCTSIMVGKKASADGSVITSHTCDGNYRTWMNIVPARTNDHDTTVTIYNGLMHTENSKDMTGVKIKGTIPDIEKTYSYLNTAYPCLNEKQLGIGETTITGRKELINENGMFMIEELCKIALERCSTAREAIRLIGSLVKEYGYCDAGECLTIADPKEVWHFEIFGEGPDKIGGVWAAVRIPDEHIGVSANIPRISIIDTTDNSRCMASENVFETAKKLGYWDGKEPFKFWKVYGGNKKAFNIREYFILSYLAPSLDLQYEAEELPISVKPDKSVSVNDVMALLRQTYEGTEYDMTQNLKITRNKAGSSETETITSPYANPWMTTDMVNMLNGIKDSTVIRYRLVSVPQCSYSHVIQLRDWLPDEVGGIAWIAFDNPGQSPRIPVFAGATTVPASFEICGQHRFRTDASVWNYRRANKLATVKWGATRQFIEEGIAHYETKAFSELPYIEEKAIELLNNNKTDECRNFLTDYTNDFANSTARYWWEMGDKFWLMFARGF